MKYSLIPFVVTALALFEGEDAAAAAAAKAAADKAAAVAGKTFTQEELNSVLAKDRKAHMEKLEKLQTDLQLTAEQRATMETQLEEIKSASLTEKEQLARKLKKQEDDSQLALKNVTSDRDSWKTRYTSSTIENALTGASVAAEAYNPSQIFAILGPRARIVETLGEDGKPNGNFGVKVKVKTVDSKKQPVELDLEPAEAVKTLKEMGEFANLFKGTQIPGAGGSSGSNQKPGNIDLTKLTHDEYMKLRKENPKALGLK